VLRLSVCCVLISWLPWVSVFSKTTAVDDDDEEITSESEPGSEGEENMEEASSQQKQPTLKRSDYPHLISKRHKAFEKYRY